MRAAPPALNPATPAAAAHPLATPTRYRSQTAERAFWVEEGQVEGTLPRELEGTLLRNGPGLFEVGGKRIPQPFDGDGLVAMFAFKGGRAFFANRYVRTEGEAACCVCATGGSGSVGLWLATPLLPPTPPCSAAFLREQAEGRMLYRGAFSVGNPAESGLWNRECRVVGAAATCVAVAVGTCDRACTTVVVVPPSQPSTSASRAWPTLAWCTGAARRWRCTSVTCRTSCRPQTCAPRGRRCKCRARPPTLAR